MYLGGCRHHDSHHPNPSSPASDDNADHLSASKDSIAQIRLLQRVYRWHEQNQAKLPDFEVVIKDSFQIRLNHESFNRVYKALKQTDYFSASFLKNYKVIGDSVNAMLTNPNKKYLNEINFSFQDADPWTYFQDEFPNFWMNFIITNYHSDTASARLKWTVEDKTWKSEPYAVRFSKENAQWKIDYLQGFDTATVYK